MHVRVLVCQTGVISREDHWHLACSLVVTCLGDSSPEAIIYSYANIPKARRHHLATQGLSPSDCLHVHLIRLNL